MIWALYIGGLLLAVALVGLVVSFRYSRRRYPPMSAQELEELEQDGLNARDRLELHDARLKHQDDLRTSVVQALVGVAVLGGAFLAYQAATADRGLTRQGQASERFTRAIDQLGNDRRREAQIGGIYGLEQIARQSPDENRLAVTEVLVAYLHRRAAKPSPGGVPRHRDPDVQAALTVLGRRQPAPADPPLDLAELTLAGAGLRGANLRGATLHGTILYNADLTDADLTGVNLRGADLRYATLTGADLRDADLYGAKANQRTSWPSGFDWHAAGATLT
jgi:hypothetical protein